MTSDHGEDRAGVVFFFEMMTGFSAKPESAYFAGGTKTCGFFALAPATVALIATQEGVKQLKA